MASEMLKTYKSKEEAEAGRPAAEAFFGEALGRAIAALPEDLRPFADDKMAKVDVDWNSGGWGNGKFFWALFVDYNLRNRGGWGSTKVKQRADGSVNQENLNAAVWGYCNSARARKEAHDGMTANKAALDAMPPDVAKYLEPTKIAGTFDFTLKSSEGLQIIKRVSADQARRLAPVVDHFNRAYLHALYPVMAGDESASVVSILDAK